MSKTVTVSFPGRKKVDAHIDGFTVKTDQKVISGGEGTAPQPFDLFFVSLATCAGIYALEFCLNRDIPTDGLDLQLQADRSEGSKLFDQMAISMTLPEDFPPKYRDAIIRAVNLCTVKKYIVEKVNFNVYINNS